MRRQANTVLVEDVSGSMTEEIQGFKGQKITKIEALKEANRILLQYKAQAFPQDLVGCVTFNDRGRVLFNLTKPNHPLVTQKLQAIQAGGTTNMTEGLELAITMLAEKPTRFLRNIILLSDGEPNTGDPSRIIPLALAARKLYININCIGFGDGTSVSFDEELLRRIARTTHNGRYQSCKTLGELVKAFRRFG